MVRYHHFLGNYVIPAIRPQLKQTLRLSYGKAIFGELPIEREPHPNYVIVQTDSTFDSVYLRRLPYLPQEQTK